MTYDCNWTRYALVAAAMLGMGQGRDVQRIIGGSTAPTGEFPFVVHLFKNGSPFCGGTLIDYNWVLTAAHCVAESSGSGGAGTFSVNSASDFTVGYGTNSGSAVETVDVEQIVVNGAFDPVWYTSDIALLKIKSNNDLLSKARTIPIATDSISAGRSLKTVGWGQTSNDNSAQASALMEATLVTAADDICSSGANDWNGQNGRYICTSYSTVPGVGTCFGDSGGPLLVESGDSYKLLGLVSFDVNTKDATNTKCAQTGNISYFTRISSYLTFISSTTGVSDSALVGNVTPISQNASTSSSSNGSKSNEDKNDAKESDSDNSEENKNQDSEVNDDDDDSSESNLSDIGVTGTLGVASDDDSDETNAGKKSAADEDTSSGVSLRASSILTVVAALVAGVMAA